MFRQFKKDTAIERMLIILLMKCPYVQNRNFDWEDPIMKSKMILRICAVLVEQREGKHPEKFPLRRRQIYQLFEDYKTNHPDLNIELWRALQKTACQSPELWRISSSD
ncbi:unnamed protein product [Caenorhabditis angaria]|uniref:Uncharacterized protein n=1 Tax=Caenorhabditis angaria TaxID=860376 RepID=A0A9P1J3C1_9PELO|nr:unnamed protein product [Caenorhabditis angaria]